MTPELPGATACAWPIGRSAEWHGPYPAAYYRCQYHYMHRDDNCSITGECNFGPEHQALIELWHRKPMDGYGGCHLLKRGFTCAGCLQEQEGAAGHGPEADNGARIVLCKNCSAAWVKTLGKPSQHQPAYQLGLEL